MASFSTLMTVELAIRAAKSRLQVLVAIGEAQPGMSTPEGDVVQAVQRARNEGRLDAWTDAIQLMRQIDGASKQ